MFGLGAPEIIAILAVMLLLFGSRLPSVMRSLGKSVTEFKKGMNEVTEEHPIDQASGGQYQPAQYHTQPPQYAQPQSNAAIQAPPDANQPK